MTYKQDYERWFRETGQFVEPAGDLKDLGKLDLLKAWGQSVYGVFDEMVAEAKKESETATSNAEDADENLRDFKTRIEQALDIGGTNDEMAGRIRKIITT